MRRGMPVLLSVQVLAVLAALGAPAAAVAASSSGPHESIDYSFTTTQPGSPTGIDFSGHYHAAGDESGNPPFLKRMVFHPPAGGRIDTSVPDRCSASDLQLEIEGPAACPAGSRLGGGTTNGIFMAPFAHSVVLDHYTHTVDVMNGPDEQITLVHAEGYSVVRGQVRPDGSIEYDDPTCFPSPPAGGCVDDYVLQLGATTVLPAYTRTVAGSVRSYATTPPTCPSSGHWTSTIDFWWSDGSVDHVDTAQPCSAQ
jgi:hypothetical protein